MSLDVWKRFKKNNEKKDANMQLPFPSERPGRMQGTDLFDISLLELDEIL